MNRYFNRELSWLEFNRRVLEIFDRKNLTLGEKTKFISIFSANLDEFTMVRIGSLRQLADQGVEEPDLSGQTPPLQLDAIGKQMMELVDEAYGRYRLLVRLLKDEGILFAGLDSLTGREVRYLETFFRTVVVPQLDCRLFGPGEEFPFVRNKSIQIFLKLEREGKILYGNVRMPESEKRLVDLWEGAFRKYVFLDDLLASRLEELFPGCQVLEHCRYRVTRNADLEYPGSGEGDLLTAVEETVRRRSRGRVVRLEVEERAPEALLSILRERMDLRDRDVFRIPGPLDLTFLEALLKKKWFRRHLPQPPEGRDVFRGIPRKDLFRMIRRKDFLCHVPYDDFSCVLEFLQAAARDEEVVSIKQTLYRVSRKSPIIEALAEAARTGKDVTVLLEVKARFDEENNIAWAKKLVKAGVQVLLSPQRLKTHSKLCLVVRSEKDAPGGHGTYCHLSTGNYNEKTASAYEDLGIFTADPQIGEDVLRIFRFLSGGQEPGDTASLIPSPFRARERLTALIAREAEEAAAGRPAGIRMKMNSLIDREIIDRLYEAARAGVRIDLIVRGICGLVPEENIRVKSVVGRFLEHSRIYCFHHGGEEELYLSSMDLMERNFDRRVETLNPVRDPEIRERIGRILDDLLRDTENSYELDAEGRYRKVRGGEPFDVQDYYLNGETR